VWIHWCDHRLARFLASTNHMQIKTPLRHVTSKEGAYVTPCYCLLRTLCRSELFNKQASA
jgi:hypothetical protein